MATLFKQDIDGTIWKMDSEDPTFKSWSFVNAPEYQAWLANGGVLTNLESHAERQQIMRLRIARERNVRAAYEFQMGGHWYQAKDTNKLDLAGILLSYILAILSGQTIPQGAFGTWLTVDESEVPITQEFAIALLQAAQMHVKACEDNKRAHIAAMELVEHPGQYDYSSGWPARYEA